MFKCECFCIACISILKKKKEATIDIKHQNCRKNFGLCKHDNISIFSDTINLWNCCVCLFEQWKLFVEKLPWFSNRQWNPFLSSQSYSHLTKKIHSWSDHIEILEPPLQSNWKMQPAFVTKNPIWRYVCNGSCSIFFFFFFHFHCLFSGFCLRGLKIRKLPMLSALLAGLSALSGISVPWIFFFLFPVVGCFSSSDSMSWVHNHASLIAN